MRQLKISQKITSRETAALDKYLNEVSKINPLTPEQEVDLTQRYKAGDEDALEFLVKSNLKFVISVAKQYQNNGLTLNDLINEGNVGLLKAARRFDETKGFKFITYAVWWIRQAILKAIVENSRIIRLPHNKHHLTKKIQENYQSFIQENEREPSPEEISDLFGININDIEDMLQLNAKHLSLDEPIGSHDGAMSYIDTLGDDNTDSPDLKAIEDSMKHELYANMKSLAPREREILIDLFGLFNKPSKSIEEVSDDHGISIERIRQVRDHAFRRLKRSFSRNNFKPFQV